MQSFLKCDSRPRFIQSHEREREREGGENRICFFFFGLTTYLAPLTHISSLKNTAAFPALGETVPICVSTGNGVLLRSQECKMCGMKEIHIIHFHNIG